MKQRIAKKKIKRIIGTSRFGNPVYAWTTNKSMGYKGSDMIADEDLYSFEIYNYRKPKYGVLQVTNKHLKYITPLIHKLISD